MADRLTISLAQFELFQVLAKNARQLVGTIDKIRDATVLAAERAKTLNAGSGGKWRDVEEEFRRAVPAVEGTREAFVDIATRLEHEVESILHDTLRSHPSDDTKSH